jgi:hypothetical protein
LAKTGTDPPTRSYKVEQTPRGALITVCGDAIDEVVAYYARLRVKLETEGFRIALEE